VSKRINVNPDHYKVAGRERGASPAVKAPKETAHLEKMRARVDERARADAHSRGKRAAKAKR
jgi:hypothetical protein